MVASLLLLIAGPQNLGPTLPPGVGVELARTVSLVEERLNAKDFPGAAKSAKLLPKLNLSIAWDEANVPLSLRPAFRAQREDALKTWSAITGSHFMLVTGPADVTFSFVPSLPPIQRQGMPAGEEIQWGEVEGHRLSVKLALQKGIPLEAIDPVNVRNEVAHALGLYFGLANSPFPGTLMGSMDVNLHQAPPPNTSEQAVAMRVLEIADELRRDVVKHVPVTPAKPRLTYEPTMVELGQSVQGSDATFKLKLSNAGNAPMAVTFTPDCGCVVTQSNATIGPGGSYDLEGRYDTTQRFGDIHHQLIVTSNDPSQAIFTIPIHVELAPRYRVLMPSGDVVKLPREGTSVTVYVLVSDGVAFTPKAVHLSGLPGRARIEPWSGVLADPDLGESEKPRKGYMATVDLTGVLPSEGRCPASLVIDTDDPKFPTLTAQFYAQRGILVSPSELYLGEVGAKPLMFSVLVTGPAGSYKVTKVVSDYPNLAFFMYPNTTGSEVRIQAAYDGRGTKGPIRGSVVVSTDNPEQPQIIIPLSGVVG